MDDGLLKSSEVAQILRISTAKVYQMIKRGELPSVQIGKCVRVRNEVVRLFIEGRLPNETDDCQYASK